MSRCAQKVPCPPFYTRNGPEGEPYPQHPDDVLDELEERFWMLDQLAYGSLLATVDGRENDAVGDHIMATDVAPRQHGERERDESGTGSRLHDAPPAGTGEVLGRIELEEGYAFHGRPRSMLSATRRHSPASSGRANRTTTVTR